jgi:hypothetical protein
MWSGVPTGSETKNDSTGEDQQRFTILLAERPRLIETGGATFFCLSDSAICGKLSDDCTLY